MCEHHKSILPPRTTLRQILRFAWTIYRSPARKHLRIAQFVMNPGESAYYCENDRLIQLIRESTYK